MGLKYFDPILSDSLSITSSKYLIEVMSENFTDQQKKEIKILLKEAIEEIFEEKDFLQPPSSTTIPATEKKLISLKEVQQAVNCSAPKLYMLRKAKRFPPEIKIGNSVFFNRQAFFDFLDNGGTKAGIIS